MFIIDREFNDEYNYDATFTTTAEALRFINENRMDGNTVYVLRVSFCDEYDPFL